MKNRRKTTRREFLGEAALGLGIALCPYPRALFGIRDARAARGKRQHLIHLVDAGGWDTNWFYNFMDPALCNDPFKRIPSGFSRPELRYGSNDYKLFDGQKMAPGMHFWKDSDYSKLCLWKGAVAIVGHNFNQVISGGGSSPYNASYSSIIAAAQAAARGNSVLHYVKLAQNPTDCFTSAGMMTGFAIPSCIANQDAFTRLTSAARSGLPANQIVDAGIGKLAEAAKRRLTRATSTGLVEGFASGYRGATVLASSGYATGDAFIGMWLRYFKAMQNEAKDQLASGYGVKGGYTGWFNGRYSGFASFAANDAQSALFSSLDGNSARDVIADARAQSWRFAMAAFLVINDLSAVVDFQPSGIDGHVSRTSDVYNRLFAFAGYRELIRHLGETPNPEGGTMIDCTLLTYCSEFDRDTYFAPDNGNPDYGTNHGESFSAMLAGHRSNGGRVVGANLLGDASGVVAELRGEGAKPVPVDPVSGKVAAGGPILNPGSLLPSVLAMFEIAVPIQQVTENRAIPALIRS